MHTIERVRYDESLDERAVKRKHLPSGWELLISMAVNPDNDPVSRRSRAITRRALSMPLSYALPSELLILCVLAHRQMSFSVV
jgi:hypothetical protein